MKYKTKLHFFWSLPQTNPFCRLPWRACLAVVEGWLAVEEGRLSVVKGRLVPAESGLPVVERAAAGVVPIMAGS